MKPFLMLIRGKETEELMKKPDSFLLLTQISMRAKRNDDFSIHNLKIGEALIGDYKNIGLTERRYRTAKNDIQKYGLATFKATNKGTIAKLTNSMVYNINEEGSDEQSDKPKASKETVQRQASDETPTTNKNSNNINNVNKEKNNDRFEQFWKLYNHKKSRALAVKSFDKAIKADSFDNIIAGLTQFVKTRGKGSQYWKHPATWLNQECWKDDHKPTTTNHNNFNEQDYDKGTEGFITD